MSPDIARVASELMYGKLILAASLVTGSDDDERRDTDVILQLLTVKEIPNWLQRKQCRWLRTQS
ncbi:MAG: hypothetical protein ACTXOO_02450 [Sodalis sp. (in: enterobacteria)]